MKFNKKDKRAIRKEVSDALLDIITDLPGSDLEGIVVRDDTDLEEIGVDSINRATLYQRVSEKYVIDSHAVQYKIEGPAKGSEKKEVSTFGELVEAVVKARSDIPRTQQ